MSSYYLKTATVQASAIQSVEVIMGGGSTVVSSDLTAAEQGAFEVTPQSGPNYTVAGPAFASSYVKINSTTYVLGSSIVQASQITGVDVQFAGGITQAATPLQAANIGSWYVIAQGQPDQIIGNTPFTSNYIAYTPFAG